MTATPRDPNFPMVIEIRSEPREELLVGSAGEMARENWAGVSGDPGVQGLRMNAQDLRRLASERSEDLFTDLCNLIEASYLGVVSNQRPWGK